MTVYISEIMAKNNFLNNRKKPLDKMSGTAKNNIGDILFYYSIILLFYYSIILLFYYSIITEHLCKKKQQSYSF